MAASSDWSPAQHYRLNGSPTTVVTGAARPSVEARLAEVEVLAEARRERRRSRVRVIIWAGFVACLVGVIAVCGALLLGG